MTGIPEWAWTQVTPFTGTDEQLEKLKAAYTEMAEIINSGYRARLKYFDRGVLKAWSAITHNSEDEVLLSLYTKEELEDKKNNITSYPMEGLRYPDHEQWSYGPVLLQIPPAYSPLIFTYGDKQMSIYVPIFSLINGKFIPVV